jgi:hypothetical protein|tara:strand:- start:4637 stop:4750 length:114 start_codon:yes stop_codon:yes gene_type:complete
MSGKLFAAMVYFLIVVAPVAQWTIGQHLNEATKEEAE